MPQETQNKAEYIVIFISEFARRFGLSAVQAYRYLNRYKAIDFLDEQYNVAHTQSHGAEYGWVLPTSWRGARIMLRRL